MSEIRLSSRSQSNNIGNYKEHLKKEYVERKKNILHLIFKYLLDNNLNSVAEILQNETQAGIYYQVCDNIDLDIILQEYQSYYYTKFQKYPKIIRKSEENDLMPCKKDKPATREKSQAPAKKEKQEDIFHIETVTLSKVEHLIENKIKPLSDFENYSSEWREIAEQILKQIVTKDSAVTFKDCIGLTETIEILKEATIYPLIYPHLFENMDTWKGVLLYGPPGTGKTLLAQALAYESPSTFINVTSSAFVSKWRGESEKMVKVLFDVAKFYSPTTIFIDEIDCLTSTYHESNHEASRRFKSELLTQVDGIVKTEKIFVLAATNNPWIIDKALLRRFEKRIFVPLPDKNSRNEIFQYYFRKNGQCFKNEELIEFVNLTENFSASDIKVVCKEVKMIVLRDKLNQIKSEKTDGRKSTLRPIKSGDVLTVLKRIKPAIDKEYNQKYVDWGSKYGAV